MSETFRLLHELIAVGEVRISEHGYDELAADQIFVREILQTFSSAVVIEDYPDYHKGPCVLVLQRTDKGEPIHVVWGLPKEKTSPAVVVTAYRPDPERWDEDFLVRKQK